MQENKHPVGGVLVHYQPDVKLGCAHSCMAAHIPLTIESLYKNCKISSDIGLFITITFDVIYEL